jgi:hypothetical protein
LAFTWTRVSFPAIETSTSPLIGPRCRVTIIRAASAGAASTVARSVRASRRHRLPDR